MWAGGCVQSSEVKGPEDTSANRVYGLPLPCELLGYPAASAVPILPENSVPSPPPAHRQSHPFFRYVTIFNPVASGPETQKPFPGDFAYLCLHPGRDAINV